MNLPARSLIRCGPFLLLFALVCGPDSAGAASPRPTLLRFVPADTALCVLLEGVRDRGNALAASPFVARLAQTPLGKSASGLAEVQQLLRIEKQIERFTGLATQKLREEVLGDLVVLAYKPGPADRPELEEGLILVHARDARALAELVRHINAQQKQSGELRTVEERKHRGHVYYRRLEKEAPTFYHLRDSVLLFSGQEAMLRRALDLDADLGADAVAPLEKSLLRLGVAGSLITFWINPREYDADLNAKWTAARDDPTRTGEAAFLKMFLAYWKALDGLALGLQLDADLGVSLAVSANPDRLPASGRAFFGRLTEVSRLWQTLPADPLFALASRLDFKALYDGLCEFLTPENRQKLEAELNNSLGAALDKDFSREILPALGADVGLIVLPPGREAKTVFPSVLLALRVRAAEGPAPLDQALLSGLHSLATLATLGHNRQNPGKPLTLKRATLDKLDIRYLVGERTLLPGVQPAFALARGHLTVASSPEALRLLSAFLSDDTTAEEKVAGAVPILRVSFKAWRGFLSESRDAIVAWLVASDGLSAEEARARILGWIAALEFVDRLEVRHQPGPDRMLLQITLRPAWSLR